MKIAFLTLGCKLNYAETSTYMRGFSEAGLEIVPWQEKADIYLVNTCSVTATSDSKSRNLIRKMHRINPDARIVVTGCSAQLRRSEIEAIDGVWRVFGCNEKSSVVPETLSRLSATAEPLSTAPSTSEIFGAYGAGERTRAYLKVQDGCDNRCLYCTVPLARGESRNLPICECVRMAEKIAESGAKEVVITGVNTGDFGRSTGESFLDLLKALDKVEGIERYRISSIEPNLLTDGILDWIAAGSKVQPHFHIPLQTGCDQLLKAMGRHYDTAFFENKIRTVRQKLGDAVFLGIDVMVGLPGESPEMFRQTVDFLQRIRPAFIHVFPYSRRPGTPAASMPGQVSEEVKKERVAELENLSSRLHEAFVSSQRGQKAKVLFESRDKGGTMSGYTGNYIRVSRPYDKSLVGSIVEIEL